MYSRVVLITPSSWFKLLPVVFVFLLVYYLRKHLSFWKSEWFRGVSNFLHFESFLMGISMGPILILNIMAENDSNMIDLVLTHLTHPWGPPWTLVSLGDPWRPLATLGDMLENDHFGGNWSFSSMSPRVAKGRQGPPRVSKVQGGPQGWVRWVLTRSIIFKSFSYMIFKIGPFPHWKPH